MKNRVKFILIIIIIILLAFMIFLNVVRNNIKATNDIDILTKSSIFDIIDNVEEIAITCISTDGDMHLTEENKLDFTILYIIKNNQKYQNDINPSKLNIKNEYSSIGKINDEMFLNIAEDFFYNINYEINDYKYYNDNYIELYFEPCNYFTYDKKEIVSNSINRDKYDVIVKYTRSLNEIKNKVYVKYEINFNMKIQDITILSSMIN